MKPLFFSLGLCMAVLSLQGCGFRPLYAENGFRAKLSSIELDLTDSRTGFFVEQNLIKNLGSFEKGEKAYRLKVVINERFYGIGFRTDESTTRSEMTNLVLFELSETATGKVLFNKSFTEVVTFNSSFDPHSSIVTQQDAQKRVAGIIALRIESELSNYFLDQK